MSSENLVVVDHPLVQHKLTLMREQGRSTSEFRQLLREISQLLAYEITRDLPLTTKSIETPLTAMDAPILDGKKLALVSILRAGNGLLDGVLDLIPAARVGFVGLYRDEETLQPVQYYLKLPGQLDERRVIVVDPMLATAGSAISAIAKLRDAGATDLRFVCLVAAPEGIERLHTADPDVTIITASVDDGLNEIGYIVPGLGDAGDRIYGTE